MPIKAFLYDATGTDREVKLDAELVKGLHDRQLLWVDVSQFTESEIRNIGTLFSLSRESVGALLSSGRRPRLDNYGAYFQLNVDTIQEAERKYSVIELH